MKIPCIGGCACGSIRCECAAEPIMTKSSLAAITESLEHETTNRISLITSRQASQSIHEVFSCEFLIHDEAPPSDRPWRRAARGANRPGMRFQPAIAKVH